MYTALFLVSCFTVGNVRNSFNSDGWKEIKPNEANVVSENSLLVTKEQDKKELLYQRVLKKTEEEKWGRGREGEETEGKKGHYCCRSGSAVDVYEAGAVHAACLCTAPAVTGDQTQSEGHWGRRCRSLARVVVQIMVVVRLGAGWVGHRWLRQRCRDEAGRALVRDTGRQDRHEGEQEPARAGDPKRSLGPGQKPKTQKAPSEKHVSTSRSQKASLKKSP